MKKNEWLDLYMGGDEFKAYVEAEQKTVLKIGERPRAGEEMSTDASAPFDDCAPRRPGEL